MKEYIKLFNDLQSADGYVINDIPFTCTAISGDGTGNINLRCNEEDKKLEVTGDTIEIVDKPTPTTLYLQDGSTVELTGDTITSAMTSSYTSTLVGVKVGNTVTSIGSGAFYGRTGLSAITIPNTVTSIGDYAFRGCSSFPVINNIRYADTYLVEAADKTLTSYIIKDGTKWIGSNAFEDCRNLTSVTIPNSVTTIHYEAFHSCTSLTSISIPNSVTSIGKWTFYNCRGLTSISYEGTISQWSAITKGNDWHMNVPATVVHCTDGDINL